ncbi:MAG: radical SAM protein [Deltaproteobacteria bacterium]|nr:radical SAM protein [Deltaproteobacteria bacterium]
MERGIDELARELLEPLLRARPQPSQWRLVAWDAEQGVQVTLGRGDVMLLVELERRDEARDCYARTARFNVCARRTFRADLPLGDAERRAVDAFVAMIRAREVRLPLLPERPTTSRGAAVREIEVDRVLIPEGLGHYYVNPYVGCMIGCEFCYVDERADLSRELEGLPRLPWGRWVDVKVNAAEVLRREVREHPPGIVRMSPIVTDPYQPLERRYRVTRQCLEVLVDAGFTPMVLTRAARIRDDFSILSRAPGAIVGFSIPTDDDRMRQHFEPGADPVEARLEALEEAHRHGLRTCAVIQPMLPMNVERLVDRVAPFASVVRVDRMYRMDRARALYDRAGCAWAAEDAFFERTAAELRSAFAARGVRADELDDLAAAMKAGPPRG